MSRWIEKIVMALNFFVNLFTIDWRKDIPQRNIELNKLILKTGVVLTGDQKLLLQSYINTMYKGWYQKCELYISSVLKNQ